MRRIDDDDYRTIEVKSNKGWIGPALGVLVFGFAAFWAFNHISNGCTGLTDVFTYCSGATGSVLITK